MSKDYPYWAFRTKRIWRAAKRKAVADLLRALDPVRMGCAYYPNDGMGEVASIQRAIEALQKKLSVKEWGR